MNRIKNNERTIYKKFGKYYDILYDPFIDYKSDCDFIEKVLSSKAKPPLQLETRSDYLLLDAGCGTGNHTFELARRGFNLIGFDISHESLSSAYKKIHGNAEVHKKVHLFQQDIKDLFLKTKFDAVMALFGVLSYIPENASLSSIFNILRDHIRTGGLLIGEIWQKSGVLPEFKNRSVGYDPTNNLELVRHAESRTQGGSDITEVKMHFTLKNRKSGDIIDEFTEFHFLRSYDLFDFTEALTLSGFELVRFTDADTKVKDFKHINPKTLRTFFIAKAIPE